MTQDWRCAGMQPDNTTMTLPEYASPAFKQLISEAEARRDTAGAAALRRQITASEDEQAITHEERADPLGEAQYCVTPFLVHQYYNRVLLLSTGKCLSYCRYCFRREFTARNSGFISPAALEQAAEYIEKTPHIQEVLVSGGDPLTGSFEQLTGLLNRLRTIRPDLLLRLCTRAPIFAPELFTKELIGFLRQVRPLWVILHVNHPAELGAAQTAAINRLINSGIPIQSQTVLLRHVNDNADVLAPLFHRLVCLGVKPSYLFQMDLAHGTAGFRVSLETARCIWKELKHRLSGLSMPQFAVDLPDGGGKFPLSAVIAAENIVQPIQNNQFSARGIDGNIHTYPAKKSD